MDWLARIDAYCERLGPGLWAEPLNAVSNLAFLIAAWVMWRRVRGQDVPYVRALIVILVLIGLLSTLWHMLARGFAGALDSVSILLFVLVYFFAANRRFFGLAPLPAGVATAAFLPYSALFAWLFSQVPFLAISAGYWPIVLLILSAAAFLRRRHPETARGLALGAAILAVSITARSLDAMLCEVWPLGTHFLWHVLNACMLGWMTEVLRRHLLAEARVRR